MERYGIRVNEGEASGATRGAEAGFNGGVMVQIPRAELLLVHLPRPHGDHLLFFFLFTSSLPSLSQNPNYALGPHKGFFVILGFFRPVILVSHMPKWCALVRFLKLKS